MPGRARTSTRPAASSTTICPSRGPIDALDAAESYLQAVARLSQIVTGVDTHKVFADGDDVCVIYDLHTQPVPDSRMA